MKSVLITGANRGLGLEFVRQILALANPPRHVFACCRSPEKAQELQEVAKENSTVTVLKIDNTDKATFPDAVKKVDSLVGGEGLSTLINNAGTIMRSNVENATAEEMESVYRVNVIGTLAITQAFLPYLKQAAKFTSSDETSMSFQLASIVNISSIAGCISNPRTRIQLAYNTSKAAVNMMTNCMAQEFSPYGIMAVAMHPGWTQTDMGGQQAPVRPEESIEGMLATLSKLKGREASGKLYGWDGNVLTW